MKKRKILFLITKSNWGGAQRYVFDLATNLPADTFEVAVALGGDGPLMHKLTEAKIRVIQIPGLQRDVSLTKEILATRAIATVLTAERPDILHINSSKAGIIGTAIGRLYRIPRIIFTAHGWAFNEDRPWLARIGIKTIHWLTVLLSHTTIAVSHGMKGQLTWPGAQQKMIVVHPGRTITAMKSKSDAREEIITYAPHLANARGMFWIGCIGELHPIKRHPLSIKAMQTIVATHPDTRLIIIGSGELLNSLQTLITEAGLAQYVFLTGAIPEAARLLPAFDLFVLPSKSESYGYVLVEAGQAKLPVISTRTGGITDLITDSENGLLVPVDNQSALTDALLKLITNNDLRNTLAENHFNKMKNVTVEKMTAETIAVYNNMGVTPQ